jgi:hypothetical protein
MLPENRFYVTKTVCFQPKPTPAKDDRDIKDIIPKMHGVCCLSICNATYATLYAQCKRSFPEVAQDLVKPEMFQTSFVLAYPPAIPSWQPAATAPNTTTSPTHQSWTPRAQSLVLSARVDDCAFCTQNGHMVHRCPGALEYIARVAPWSEAVTFTFRTVNQFRTMAAAAAFIFLIFF